MAARFLTAFCLLTLYVASVSSSYIVCPLCNPAACPVPSCSHDSGLRYPDNCLCCARCYRSLGERCGGRTDWQCKPGLTCSYRLGAILGEERTGVCEKAACVRVQCGYRRLCVANDQWETSCSCSRFRCEGKDNPVCGYNGVTYPSVCQLQWTECRDDVFIGIRHFGSCTSEDDLVGLPQSTGRPPALPSNPLLAQQLGQQPQQAGSGCIYQNVRYDRNTLVLADHADPCRYFLCSQNGILSEIMVPGCQGGPVDVDYHVEKPVAHGGWSAYTPWSPCEGTCATGQHNRSRTCTSPVPRYEGRDCHGDEVEIGRCIPPSCNLSCTYTQWSNWSVCAWNTCVSTQTRSLGYPVPFEELCELAQHRNCSPDVCSRGECSVRMKLDYRTNENNCTTVYREPAPFCGGTCADSEEEEQEGAWHCEVKRSRVERLRVHCPWEIVDRLWPFDVIKKCVCRRRRNED